jgi:hypothetical protein
VSVRYITHAPELGPKEWPTVSGPPVELPPPPYEPTVTDLAVNFTGAMARLGADFVDGKRLKVTHEEYLVRAHVCDHCEYWQPEAYFGVGRCAHKRCGCTRLKAWLVSQHCPLGKWPELAS